MDTSNPSVFVNAELLRLYVGRQVRALIQVVQPGAGSVIGNSTDGVQLIVKGTPPSSLTKFVEVIGIADSDKSIQASIWNNFGDTIDTHAYNQLCCLQMEILSTCSSELQQSFVVEVLQVTTSSNSEQGGDNE